MPNVFDSRSSRILGHCSTNYSTPNNGRISNIFWIVRRGRVIRRSLMYYDLYLNLTRFPFYQNFNLHNLWRNIMLKILFSILRAELFDLNTLRFLKLSLILTDRALNLKKNLSTSSVISPSFQGDTTMFHKGIFLKQACPCCLEHKTF